jgi:hypothetical protein
MSSDVRNIICIDVGMRTIGYLHVEHTINRLSNVMVCKTITIDVGEPERMAEQFLKGVHDALVAADVIVVKKRLLRPMHNVLDVMLRARFGSKCVAFTPGGGVLRTAFVDHPYTYESRKEQRVQFAAAHVTRWTEAGIPGAATAKRYIDTMNKRDDIYDAILLMVAWQHSVHDIDVAATPVPLPRPSRVHRRQLLHGLRVTT